MVEPKSKYGRLPRNCTSEHSANTAVHESKWCSSMPVMATDAMPGIEAMVLVMPCPAASRVKMCVKIQNYFKGNSTQCGPNPAPVAK